MTRYKIYKPWVVKLMLNLWPPLWGAGIKVVSISDDFRFVKMRLKFRWWNKNAHKTQYGGSIFSMTDPVYALMLMGLFKEKYFIWDKSADIEFIKPGASDLFAEFVIDDETIEAIKQATATGEKYFPQFVVNVVDDKGDLVSTLRRVLYIRKKSQYR